MAVRQRTIYTGRVQGVGFRATTRAIAGRFPVTGFVRNEDDGTVLCEAQGDAGEVAAFVMAVRAELARFIAHEHTTEIVADPSEAAFTVRH